MLPCFTTGVVVLIMATTFTEARNQYVCLYTPRWQSFGANQALLYQTDISVHTCLFLASARIYQLQVHCW